MSPSNDPDAALDELLRALDVKVTDTPSPATAEAALPAAARESKPSGPDGVVGALMQRLEALEGQLREERARSAAADARSQAQDEVRREVDEQLRRTLESVRQAQGEAHSRGRIEALEARLDDALKRILDAAERPRLPVEAPLPSRDERLDRLLERLEVVALRHEREAADMTALKVELHRLTERLERRRVAASESLAALDAQAMQAVQRVTAAAEALERGLGSARAAAAQTREALSEIGPRGEAMSHAAELLERQRRLEERLEEALRQLVEKDRLLSAVTEALRRAGGRP